jgi:serine/threonine protein kinase
MAPDQWHAAAGEALPAGARIGAYEIRGRLGRGGMGEVYRAHDTRLQRDVAVKTLPPLFMADPERRARFEREARVLASLNHPHIASIFGIEDTPGGSALVLELVEGQTLADRIQHGPIPLPDALTIARQIADALDAAHEKGIIHRDLKPANVALTADGNVKVLDFGLAKLIDISASDAGGAATITANMTGEGMIVGTAAYMSPEQARGQIIDKRTDIWAFGCVLFEVLSQRPAFARDTGIETLAAVLEHKPDWSSVPAGTPAPVRRLLERCLEKDPKRRLRDIGDARMELDAVLATPADAASPPGDGRRLRPQWWWAAAGTVVAIGAAGLLWIPRSQPTSPGDLRVSRVGVDLPDGQVILPGFNSDVALSPDGTRLAFTTLPGPVFVRRLDSLSTTSLESVKGYNTGPLFSPDGASISYIHGNAIISAAKPFLKAALSGGAPVTLTQYDMFHRGDWGADGWIYWTGHYPGGIIRSRDSGGPSEPVTQLDVDRGERSHRFASLLPDGSAIIYTVGFDGIGSYDDARIDLWDMRTREHRTLITGGTSATYSPSGHIIYARAGKLYAVPFDLKSRTVTGGAFEALNGVLTSGNTGAAHYSLSRRGDLAYVPGPAADGHRTLVWVDRSGKAEPLPLPPASYLYPRLSPDGRYLAVEVEGPNHDLHMYDFARGVLSKITTDGLSHDPVWTPDGKGLAFRSWQAGGMTMWSMPADQSAAPVRLDPRGTRQSPVSFSPDGKFLSFDQMDEQTMSDAFVLPVPQTGAAIPIARSKWNQGAGRFSPDGRWIAYVSDESGQPEVYVQPFPGPGAKLQISKDGGYDPLWRHSGGELYYRQDDKMMVVAIAVKPPLQASAPKVLWRAAGASWSGAGLYSEGSGSSCGMPGATAANYDVSADGSRFLMVRDDDAAVAAKKIVVVVNWTEEVKQIQRAAGTPSTRTARK